MNDLLGHLPFVRCYIDDVLIVTKTNWKDHINAINSVLEVMSSAGLKVNAEKSFFLDAPSSTILIGPSPLCQLRTSMGVGWVSPIETWVMGR